LSDATKPERKAEAKEQKILMCFNNKITEK
jgi:hypothetical protein